MPAGKVGKDCFLKSWEGIQVIEMHGDLSAAFHHCRSGCGELAKAGLGQRHGPSGACQERPIHS